MKLEDKLNKVLKDNGLQVKCEPEAVAIESHPSVDPQPVNPETIQFATFDTLRQMVKSANKIQPDEDGVRVGFVKTVGLNEMKLPMVRGKFIVDDIQKNGKGYEVHLVENPLREQNIG